MAQFMNKEKFLVVDDDATITSNISSFLATCGYDNEIANNGTEALELFKQKRHPVVLLDISMPGMSGLQVLEEIKKLTPKTQVIMVSGNDDKDTIDTAMQGGAYDFVTKPFVLRILIRRVHMAYLESLSQNLNFKLNDGIVTMINEFFKLQDMKPKEPGSITEQPIGVRNTAQVSSQPKASSVNIGQIISDVTKNLWKK